MVLVPVTVTDRYGKTISGLQRQDFTLLDDRARQTIVSLNSEDNPCSVGLVLDISGSMRNALGTAKSVLQAFLKTTNPEDEYMLLTVSTEPHTPLRFTSDLADVERRIELTHPGGMTALIDTVYLGLGRMKEAKQPRRALLILSDGLDNNSRFSKSKLLRIAIEADVQIYTIILDNGLSAGTPASIPFRPSMIKKPGDQVQERQSPKLLEELADKTGGLHFHVRNNGEANEAATKVGRAIRDGYLIGYHPPQSGAAGKWHRIRVKANVPDVSVYAREGYYSR